MFFDIKTQNRKSVIRYQIKNGTVSTERISRWFELEDVKIKLWLLRKYKKYISDESIRSVFKKGDWEICKPILKKYSRLITDEDIKNTSFSFNYNDCMSFLIKYRISSISSRHISFFLISGCWSNDKTLDFFCFNLHRMDPEEVEFAFEKLYELKEMKFYLLIEYAALLLKDEQLIKGVKFFCDVDSALVSKMYFTNFSLDVLLELFRTGDKHLRHEIFMRCEKRLPEDVKKEYLQKRSNS
jgi:hypothetical protein